MTKENIIAALVGITFFCIIVIPLLFFTGYLDLGAENKYSIGDILRAEGQGLEYAYCVLDYDEKTEHYQTAIIQFINDKWTYTDKPKEWNERKYIEKTLQTAKINYIDPASISIQSPASVMPTQAPTITPAPTLTPTSAPTPTITPETTKEPEILSSKSYIDNLGYFKVVGEVKNTLPTNINYVKITATFYDAQEKVIGTAFTYTELDILKPNQKSAFELSSYPDMIEPASRKLKVSYKETGNEPFAGLTILSHSAKIGKLGYHEIVGEVQNEGTKKSSFVRVVCTYYDANGKVIGTSFTYTDPNEIDAGDSAPFELSSYPMELRPANYELQVQGK